MNAAKRLASGACLLGILALPGLRAEADGAVTLQNLVSLSYSSGGMVHEEGLLLGAGGMVRADVSDRRGSVPHRQISSKLKPAQVSQILRLVNAVNFPALRPQPGSPREIDGDDEEIALTYRNLTGRQQHYYHWNAGDGPRPLAELYSYLGHITRQELKALTVRHKARRRHRHS